MLSNERSHSICDRRRIQEPLNWTKKVPFLGSAVQLTRAGDYAVRVMVHLASAPWGSVIPRREIQGEQGVPPAHLGKIIQALGRAKLVLTFRGAGGGVRLAVRPEEVTLRRVIEAVEGPVYLNRCLVAPGACPRDWFCTVHPVWHRIQEVLMRELDAATMAALAVPEGSPRQARLSLAGPKAASRLPAMPMRLDGMEAG